MPKQVDVVIVGAGAAGLMCAFRAGQLGLSVLLIDHSKKLAEKNVFPVTANAISLISTRVWKPFSVKIYIL